MVVEGTDVDALINEDVVAEYRDRGYWRSPRLFDRETTALLRRAHERLWSGDFDHPIPSQYGPPRDEPDAAAVRQQCNAFWLNDDIRAVTTSPLLGAIGARLMDVDEVRLWHDQAVTKPGVGAGGAAVTAGNIGWHQDYGHWQCSSSTNMCTAWIALQDTDLGNGAMRTIVGSHRWGLLEDSANFGKKDLAGLKARLSTQDISGAWIDEPCLLREGEAEQVVELFRNHYNIPLVHREASDRFLDALADVDDPERKRKIIGGLFIDVFEEEAKAIGGAKFLAQGTLYPDVIESVSATGGPSVTIKSHHNVGGLPERMNMDLVEPARDLFKDEVRALGRDLGLPEAFIRRHPFPGPGLAIRIPGAVTREKAGLLRRADAIYLEEIRDAGLYDEIWQAFAALLPVRAVGVMGDERTYDWVCALRAVTSTDGMTADSYAFSHDFLSRTATRIVNEVPGISRVVYDVTSKPPGTIEWE